LPCGQNLSFCIGKTNIFPAHSLRSCAGFALRAKSVVLHRQNEHLPAHIFLNP